MAVAGFEAGDRALIAPCDNTTGDPNLQSVLNTALTTALQQPYHVQLVSQAQVRSYAASHMGLGSATDVDAAAAREACSRTAAPASGTGWEGQEPSILVRFWLGLLLEEEGETGGAQDHFARFLGYWGEGDANLRFRDADGQWVSPVEETRAHLARLGRQRP